MLSGDRYQTRMSSRLHNLPRQGEFQKIINGLSFVVETYSLSYNSHRLRTIPPGLKVQ